MKLSWKDPEAIAEALLAKHPQQDPLRLSFPKLQKLVAEQYCQMFTRLYGFETVTIRYFNVFGPRQDPSSPYSGVISLFISALVDHRQPTIYGDGEQTRDFTYVTDTAHGILLAGEHPLAIGETINVGSGSEVTINELAERVALAVGKPDAVIEHDRPRPGDVARLCADLSRARALLSYEPRVTLEDGLQRLLGWYRDHHMTVEQLLTQEVVHNWAPTV